MKKRVAAGIIIVGVASLNLQAMQLLRDTLARDRLSENRERKLAKVEMRNQEANRAYCYKAAQRGDVALVRTLVESDAEKYVPHFNYADTAKGITRMGKLVRPLLAYKQRNDQLLGHLLDTDIQKDLNQLACIAVIRLDRQATGILLDAGADIEALMTTEFTDAQVERVCDMYRGLVRFYPNRYTPLLYIAGYLSMDRGFGDREVGDLAFIRQLVYAGADFRRATPNGRIPYQEAPERVRAVIMQAERASGRGELEEGYGGQVGGLVGPEDQEVANQGLEQEEIGCLPAIVYGCVGQVRRLQDSQNAKLILGFVLLAASVGLEAWLY